MTDGDVITCRRSASGHALHPIQFRLAREAGAPEPVVFLGEHATGILVAPADALSHVETWCMHEQWRVRVREGVAAGHTTLLSYRRGLAQIGDKYVSHVSPLGWKECPAPGDLQPWQAGFFRLKPQD
ncbi:hypothetical protein [Demequina aurantiaca]|uniref:hypothetical protein n=1 Tax=Demequina aurantiaca TaxID=676200 RepID=UPI003D347E64